jgi:hypothetical protein
MDTALKALRPAPSRRRIPALAGLVLGVALAGAAGCSNAKAEAPRAEAALPGPRPLPRLLSETGLYAEGSTSEIRPEHLFYVPQYPLWSDGAAKRRFVSLPPGSHIDASRASAWEFPPGTRFWKEFTFGKRTETRYIERLDDGSFRYAAYVWDDALGDAVLAPEMGVRRVREIGSGVAHDVPSRDDCRACHEGRPGRILGFNALQLSPDRDPLAPHGEAVPADAVDLRELVRRDLIRGLPASASTTTLPRIPAPTPEARAAAGYLFGNCASCHNAEGPLSALGLNLDQSGSDPDGYARLLKSVASRPSRFRIPGHEASLRVSPGNPGESALVFRMRSRDATAQMPPLGTHLVDSEAVTLVERWIARGSLSSESSRLNITKEPSP